MPYRNITQQTVATAVDIGAMQVKQPLPAPNLSQVSPFVLLHHAGPDVYTAGAVHSRIKPHPHRGFEPVTFLISGKLHHKDSMGNEGFLEAGDVQWMTAGSGILHSEGPSAAFVKEGGTLELVQLWVNLPRKDKAAPPRYQNIKKEVIPLIQDDKGKIKSYLVAGQYNGQTGPAQTFTPLLAMVVHFTAGAATTFTVPEAYNAFIYMLNGEITVNNTTTVTQHHLALFDHAGNTIAISSNTNGKLILLAGEPIHEPTVVTGPFVMNYAGEIKQAIMDFEMGNMGTLES